MIELQSCVLPQVTTLNGSETSLVLEAEDKLKIKVKNDYILDEEVPIGKVWNVAVSVTITVTDI